MRRLHANVRVFLKTNRRKKRSLQAMCDVRFQNYRGAKMLMLQNFDRFFATTNNLVTMLRNARFLRRFARKHGVEFAVANARFHENGSQRKHRRAVPLAENLACPFLRKGLCFRTL